MRGMTQNLKLQFRLNGQAKGVIFKRAWIIHPQITLFLVIIEIILIFVCPHPHTYGISWMFLPKLFDKLIGYVAHETKGKIFALKAESNYGLMHPLSQPSFEIGHGHKNMWIFKIYT